MNRALQTRAAAACGETYDAPSVVTFMVQAPLTLRAPPPAAAAATQARHLPVARRRSCCSRPAAASQHPPAAAAAAPSAPASAVQCANTGVSSATCQAAAGLHNAALAHLLLGRGIPLFERRHTPPHDTSLLRLLRRAWHGTRPAAVVLCQALDAAGRAQRRQRALQHRRERALLQGSAAAAATAAQVSSPHCCCRCPCRLRSGC